MWVLFSWNIGNICTRNIRYLQIVEKRSYQRYWNGYSRLGRLNNNGFNVKQYWQPYIACMLFIYPKPLASPGLLGMCANGKSLGLSFASCKNMSKRKGIWVNVFTKRKKGEKCLWETISPSEKGLWERILFDRKRGLLVLVEKENIHSIRVRRIQYF
jgi:hypothetical protein